MDSVKTWKLSLEQGYMKPIKFPVPLTFVPFIFEQLLNSYNRTRISFTYWQNLYFPVYTPYLLWNFQEWNSNGMLNNKADLLKSKSALFQIRFKKQSKAVSLIGCFKILTWCSENIREILKKRSKAQCNLNKVGLQQNNISGHSGTINFCAFSFSRNVFPRKLI